LWSRLRGPGAATLYTTLAAQGMTLVTGIIAARVLGPTGRGTLALLWLIPAALSLVGGLGIPQATTFFVARERGHARTIVRLAAGTTLALAAGLVPLCGFVLVLLVRSGHDFSTLDSLLSVALVPALLSQNLAVATLLGRERFRLFNLSRLGPAVTYLVGSGLLFACGWATLTTILGAALLGWGAGGIITWILIYHDLPAVGGETPVTRGAIVRFGLRGVIGSVSPIDDVRLDQFIVGLVLDARALGLYVAAVAFCNLPRFVALSIGAVSYPRIAAARLSPEAWLMVRHYLVLGMFTVGATVSILLLAIPTILPLLFGESFSGAVPLGRILLLAAFFLSMHRLMIELARGLGHPGYGSITELINASVFLLGVVVVTGAATVQDVAWSVVAGGVASSTVLLLMLFSRYRGYQRAGGRSPDQ